MLQLFKEHLEQIRSEALQAFPHEAVWLITEKDCYQVENTHEDPENFFDVSAEDVRDAQIEGLLAVVHSHTNGQDYPSSADMQSQINTDVPWGIVTCDGVNSGQIFWWGGNSAETLESLEDRTFRHGATDCYSLVRDYYRIKLNIELPEFPREWEWWTTDGDLLRNGFEKAGFSVVKGNPKPNDVWLASLANRDAKLNHCGILTDNDLTLHHPGANIPVSSSRKATIEPIYRYLQNIQVWVRHKDLQS